MVCGISSMVKHGTEWVMCPIPRVAAITFFQRSHLLREKEGASWSTHSYNHSGLKIINFQRVTRERKENIYKEDIFMLLNIINYHQAYHIQNYFWWKGCEVGLNLHVGSFSLTGGFSRERSGNNKTHSTVFKDEDWDRVLWGWRTNLSLSDLSQRPHPTSVKAKANLALIVFWENGIEGYKGISHLPKSNSPRIFILWLLCTRIPSCISSSLSPLLWIKVLSSSGTLLSPFVFWLWDLLHSLTLLISTACSGWIGMFSTMRMKDILHHKAQSARGAEF